MRSKLKMRPITLPDPDALANRVGAYLDSIGEKGRTALLIKAGILTKAGKIRAMYRPRRETAANPRTRLS